jgi:diguanylate cyclase (GGDEF)-like protein
MRWVSARNGPIATTDNISIHPVNPVRDPSPRQGNSSITAVLRACRTYFDWHPIIGGLAASAACAIAVTALFLLIEAIMPSAGGWPICTPLNGAVLAVLLMSRRKLWPFLLLGYVIALGEGTVLAGALRHPGALEILGNFAELVLAALTLPPYRSLKQWLQERRLLRAFTAYALLLGPAIMSLSIASNLPGSFGAVTNLHAGFLERARIIAYSEALGIALGTALVLVLCSRHTYRLFRWRELLPTLGLFFAIALTTWFAFTQTAYPLIFLPYAILIAAAFVLGLRGAVLGTGLACAILCALTAHSSLSVQTGLVQSCLALTVLTVFPLSVTLFNRAELEARIKSYQSELDKLKSLDRLTGVANRKRFDLVLTREWQRATRDPKPIALLMIDTDFFDSYNEYYGTEAGDTCLRLIASKLAEHPHRQYDLISRFAGGRFSVLLPGASGDSVKRIGEEFRAGIAALELPHERSQFGRVTVSVGCAAMFPEMHLKSDLLISAAEAALTSARRKGKNRVEGFSNNVVPMSTATR